MNINCIHVCMNFRKNTDRLIKTDTDLEKYTIYPKQ